MHSTRLSRQGAQAGSLRFFLSLDVGWGYGASCVRAEPDATGGIAQDPS